MFDSNVNWRGMRLTALAWVVGLCAAMLASPGAAAQAAEGTERGAREEGLTTLQNLAQEHHARIQAMLPADSPEPRPAEYRLTLEDGWVHYATTAQIEPSGIRREDATLHTFRIGNRWTRNRLGTPSRPLSERLMIEGLDVSSLKWDGSRVQGSIRAEVGRINLRRDYGEGENMHSALKAQRRPVIDWHIGGTRRVYPSTQTFDIDARVVPGQFALEFNLTRFAGDMQPERIPDPDDTTRMRSRDASQHFERQRVPIHITMLHRDGHWLAGEGMTPGWNRAIHQLDASELTLDEDRLHGVLRVTLMPDPWVPGRGQGGKRHRDITVRVDARISYGTIEGTYKASGDQGDYEGAIEGIRWQSLAGRYTAQGVDGKLDGRISGRMRLTPERLAGLSSLHPEPFTSEIDPQPSQQLREALDAYRTVHAALLAQTRHPLTLEDRFDSAMWMPLPVCADERTEAAFIADLAKFAAAASAQTSEPASGNVASPDPQFGPFSPLVALNETALPSSAGQPGEQVWAMPQQWRTIGPIEMQHRRGGREARLPVVMPTEGVTYHLPRPKWEQTLVLERDWRALAPVEGQLRPDPETWRDSFVSMSGYGGYGSHPINELFYAHQNRERSYRWYAMTTLTSPRAQTVWLAASANDYARVWVNGQLVWETGSDYEPAVMSVFPAAFVKGENHVLIESGKHAISYSPPSETERSWVVLALCVQGQPRDADQLADAQTQLQTKYDALREQTRGYFAPDGRQYEDAQPPLQWDLEQGTNVAWRVSPGGNASPPIVVGDRLLLTAEPHSLICLDRRTGRELWRRGLDAMSGQGRGAAAQGGGAGTVPISDGQRVWAVFGSGVAVCFDLDGKLLWSTRTGQTFSGGYASSPLLVGGDLVFQAVDTPSRGQRAGTHAVVALDAATGKERWRSNAVSGGEGIAPVNIVDGERSVYAIVTPDASVIDGRDGRVLYRNQFKLVRPTQPVTRDNIAYFIATNQGQLALSFWLDGDRIASRKQWEIRRSGTSSSQITMAGFVHEHLLLIPRSSDENAGHHPVAWDQLDVYETRFGQHLARPNPVIIDSASPLPVVRAGNMVVFSDSGQRGYGQRQPRPMVAFMEIGERPTLLQRVVMPRGRLAAPPVAHGKHLYLRYNHELICVGGAEAEDRRDQLNLIARNVMGQIGPRPRLQALAVTPLPEDFEPQPGMPVNEVRAHIPPENWLMAGPLPRITSDKPVGFEPGKPMLARPGQTLSHNGQSATFKPAPNNVRILRGATMVYRSEGTFYAPTYALDINEALSQTDHTSAYFFTLLYCPKPMVINVRIQNATAWLGDVAITDSQAVRLTPGYYTMVVRADIQRFPPVGRMIVAPQFNPILAPERAMADWLDRIRQHERILRDIVAHLPPSSTLRLAQTYLQALDEEQAD